MCARYRGEGGEGSVEDKATRGHRPCPQKAAKACVFSGVSAVDLENRRTDGCDYYRDTPPGTPFPAVDCPTLKDKFEEMVNQPYKELSGALACSRFARTSRLPHNLGRAYWDTAKRVLRYLNGTTLGGKSLELAALTDADWGSHRDDRRSIGEYRGRRHR